MRHLLLIEAVVLLPLPILAPAKPGGMSQEQAEKMATRWWATCYGRDGAAWKSDGLCWVGICDGKADKPGYTRRIEGEPGAYINFTTDAKFETPDRRYYANAEWFGKGKTWEEAFYDATSHGHVPWIGSFSRGTHDFAEEKRLAESIGKKSYHPRTD